MSCSSDLRPTVSPWSGHLDQVDPSYFRTEERWQQLQDWLNRNLETGGRKQEIGGGTVAAVARDLAGHVAAATSTGGVTGSLSGRVGDPRSSERAPMPMIEPARFQRQVRVSSLSAREWRTKSVRVSVSCRKARRPPRKPCWKRPSHWAAEGASSSWGRMEQPAWSFNTPMHVSRPCLGGPGYYNRNYVTPAMRSPDCDQQVAWQFPEQS